MTATPKPCPSCGGPPIDETSLDDLNCHTGDLWWCQCECGLTSPTCSTRAGAIAQWNMLYMGTPADVAREADADAHPWGAPGVVPSDGLLWAYQPGWDAPTEAVGDGGDVYILEDNDVSDPSMMAPMGEERGNTRFRKRWTPGAPTAHKSEHWTVVDSHARKGILCALVGADFDTALFQRAPDGAERLVVHGFVAVLFPDGWDYTTVWPRLRAEDAAYKANTGHWAEHAKKVERDFQAAISRAEGAQVEKADGQDGQP